MVEKPFPTPITQDPSPISVGFALRNFSQLSGVSRYIAELAHRLPALGYQPLIAANRIPATGSNSLPVHKVRMVPLTSWMRAATFDRFARRRLSRLGAQLIHGHGDLTIQDVLSVHNCDEAAAHYIPDGRRPSTGVHYVRSRQFAKDGAKIIIANSEMVRRDLAEFYRVPVESVRRLYLGVDLDRFHPGRRAPARAELLKTTGWRPETTVVLTVLSGDPVKRNFSFLAEIVEMLARKQPAALLAVGKSGWETVDAARRLREKGRFHSVEADPNIENYYSAADVFALPAFYEEFGMTVLEALASGCPVVVSGRCGAAEILGPANGFVVRDLTDHEEWAENIRLAALFGSSNENCRKTAETFSWDRHAASLAEIYRELS